MAATVPAAAQVCTAREALVTHLARKFEEHREALGVTLNGRLLELFVSPSGTWTVVLSHPQGTSCVLSAGEGWQRSPVQIIGPEA